MSRRKRPSIGVLDLNEAMMRGTCLERFRALHAYLPFPRGGSDHCVPAYRDWSHWQGQAAEWRRRDALERVERQRFQAATGIEIVQAVELAEIARSATDPACQPRAA